MRRLLVLSLALLLLVGCSANQLKQNPYTNPVYNHDAPDPTVIRASDGYFYAYTTESPYNGQTKLFPILKSRDMTTWTLVGQVFDQPPAWASHDFWAPHILYRGGKYYLYYAAKAKNGGTTAIGVAIADKPTGPFKDKGTPVIQGGGFSTIDPFVLVDGEKLYLYWGSDRVPILVQELTADGLSVTGEPEPVLDPSLQFGGYESLVEGPWVIKRDPYYYLMYSGDDCCDQPHYAVLIARSTSPLGPFEKDPANPILVANDRWNGPGHNAAIQDDAGDWWLLYHAMDRKSASKDRVMLLDKLTWQPDGWPVPMTPSTTQQPGPQWKKMR
ncbi:MAG: glycoside hydrolase family 43 protein [Mycobacterium leprae]